MQLVTSRTERKNAKDAKDLIQAILAEHNISEVHIDDTQPRNDKNDANDANGEIVENNVMMNAESTSIHFECEARLRSIREELDALKSHMYVSKYFNVRYIFMNILML